MTGENKTKFKEWLDDYSINLNIGSGYWDYLPFEMQIGVYLAYYNSKGIFIYCGREVDIETYFFMISLNSQFEEHINAGKKEGMQSLNEAYQEAFKKADEIINGK